LGDWRVELWWIHDRMGRETMKKAKTKKKPGPYVRRVAPTWVTPRLTDGDVLMLMDPDTWPDRLSMKPYRSLLYAAMAALFSSFVLVHERLALDVAAKMAVLVLIITAVNVAWLLAGAALTRFFREPRTNRVINVAFAVLLVASVALALAF